jgi:NAD(P)-dependent dehydrogenase (short-subunit alcohol dehydrogenase family)
MRSGLFMPLFDALADPAVVARLSAEAEEAGWHGVCVWDNLRWREPVVDVADPWITLAAIATATERIRLGPMVTPLARRRPVKVARETATLEVARNARGKMRAGGTLLLMGGTGGRKISRDLGMVSAATAAPPPFTAALALAIAPVRVNLIAAGFVDTPLSASLLGDGLDARRDELRTTLPIGRVVGSADVAALAVHIMTNTALTGATYDIDGGQQFVA